MSVANTVPDHGDQGFSIPIPLRPRPSDLDVLADAWAAEYSNRLTRKRYRQALRVIAREVGANTPADLTAAALAEWAGERHRANNTTRAALTAARQFLRWCDEAGHITGHRDAPLRRLLRSYPPIYGKTQSARPAARLDATGYAALIAACQDGTDAGLRDELLVRLGVSGGMRVAELLRLTIGSLRRAPRLTWTGKANKPRTATAGPDLVAAIAAYITRYTAGLGHPPADDAPVFCPARHSRHPHELRWGEPIVTDQTLRLNLARRAGLAHLGYMAPHDLKRTAARLLHEARSTDGGHLFDLLDIADVLDHANPQVTKDCYIGPLGNSNKDRAAAIFG